MVLRIPWHFWNKWSLGCFLYRSNKNIKHELFLSFLFHSSHNNTPFFYQTNDNDILYRPYKRSSFGRNSVWRMLPGYAYLWHLSTCDMNDGLLAVVRVLKRHPHIPDHHYDELRCKFTKTKNLFALNWYFYLCYPFILSTIKQLILYFHWL